MNYKIRVANEAESKEVQELLFELGYFWNIKEKEKEYMCIGGFTHLTTFGKHIGQGFGFVDHKEITIPQLKDMVVLKRNDVADATHKCIYDNIPEYFMASDGVLYFYENTDWVRTKNTKLWCDTHLKPITKEPVMKEYLNKLEDGTYKLVVLDSVADGVEGLIEVPEGADKAFQAFSNAPVVFKRSECGYSNAVIIWQRETLNDKVASAEVARQEFIGAPFSDLPESDFEAVDVVDAEFFPDNVNQPSHYCSHPSGIECIEITRHHDFAIGNAIKYLWRAGLKDSANEIQDLEKASWYIQDKINQLKKINGNP